MGSSLDHVGLSQELTQGGGCHDPVDGAGAQAGDYPVVGLGAVGRWWQPRLALAGTYDDSWKQTRWPGLPEDFDFGYWNCAPEDQGSRTVTS